MAGRFVLRPTLLALLVCALTAAPSAAIIVKLPSGRYANYDAVAGASAPKAAQIFDAVFTNLDYSGGPVMPSNTNDAVVWQPTGYTGTAFQTGYVSGVDQFFTDMAHDSGSRTNSDSVSTQYNDVFGNTAAYSFTNGGQLLDTDPLPKNGCPVNSTHPICITDAQIQKELSSFLSGQAHDLSHEYFLLTPPSVASCFDAAGSACSANAAQNRAYCAYHSRTGTGFVYSNIPDLTGLRGCDPFATPGLCPSGFTCLYDNGPADGILTAVSHEHNESTTDPEPNNAWTDWGSGVGGEIGDKCNNDAFSDPNLKLQTSGSTDTPYNETINGRHYLIQMEWSNQGATCLDSFTTNGTATSASFTATPGSGNAVSFNASASTATGGVAEYVWQWNDGPGQTTTQETTSPTISHTFPAKGTFDVALTVMAGDGTSNGTANNVTAGGTSAPTAVFTAPAGLEGTSLTFDGSASTGSITTYTWNFGDGSPTATGKVVTHTYATHGNYTATLTVSGSGKSNSTSHTVVVTDENPTASFTFSPSSPIDGSVVSFDGSASVDPDGTIASYVWNFGDGGSGSGARVAHAFGAGTYTVTLTVTDSASGTKNSTLRTVTISDENPTAGLFASSGTAGAPVAFTGFGSDPDGTIVSFAWSFGDGGTGTGASPTHVYAKPGTYTVTVTVLDTSGRMASASESVTITSITHGLPNCEVPKLKGKSLATAKKLLRAAHCELGKVRKPRKKPKHSAGRHHKWELLVAHQSIPPGRTEPNDTKVSLKLAYVAVKTH